MTTAIPMPTGAASEPLGAARLSDGSGPDLSELGYVEHEFEVTGTATEWHRPEPGGPARPSRADVPYTTRVLVRRPARADAGNGVLHVEPLHPQLDTAMTWEATHPWIVRTGAAWLGISQDRGSVRTMREDFDPERYGRLDVPLGGLRFDIVGGIATAARTGELPLLGGFAVHTATLSGWSITGSFCRVFLGDGFHQRWRLPSGRPAFDGYLIAISSGAFGASGYPLLDDGGEPVPPTDPRRVIGPVDVPVVELLSEFEAETHRGALRADSDGPESRYRLYEVAGTSHQNADVGGGTNFAQFAAKGLATGNTAINERRSDARLDFVARAVLARLVDWAAHGQPPPRAPRFEFADAASAAAPGAAEPLRRDEVGNVVGGVRTPWVEAPLAVYRPHSTPDLRRFEAAPAFARFSPEQRAALVGNMAALSAADLAARYAGPADYLDQYRVATGRLREQGFLLEPEGRQLLATAERRAREWPLGPE